MRDLRLTLLAPLMALAISSYSQKIVWASEVIDFTTEHSSSEFSAKQALGEPNAMARGTKKSNAWKPKGQFKQTYIKVGFDESLPANQVLIAESESPGAVSRIYAYDQFDNEFLLAESTPKKSSEASGYYHQFFETTTYGVSAIKVEFDGTISDDLIAIDAIGIANEDLPITIGLTENQKSEFQNYQINRLGDHINSPYLEHNPILSTDGKTLYFSRQNHPGNIGGSEDFEDIWYAEWDEVNDNWSEAKNLGRPLNTQGPNFISSISLVNGQETFFLGNQYGKGGKMSAGLSVSYKLGGAFSEPESVSIKNDYNLSNKVDYFVANDASFLIMSVERDDTFGKRDLYISFPTGKENSWSEPVNLGPKINTFGEEESPFMSHDGKTLYFSTDGLKGYGGVDIYRSDRLDSTWTKWSEPINLGPKINGVGDEEYLSLSPAEEHLYYTRSEKSGNLDIYDVNLRPVLVVLSGKVVSTEDNKGLAGTEVLFSNKDGEYLFIETESDGTFEMLVPINSSWTLTAAKQDFSFVHSPEMTVQEEDISNIELKLTPVVAGDAPQVPETVDSIVPSATLAGKLGGKGEGESLRLERIYFDLNSSYLRPESKPELIELATYLKQNPHLEVELSAHTDSRQTKKYNDWMSDRRAKRVADFLIKHGVSSSRIESKGYGEDQLVNECADGVSCSEAQHQLNRRTEIKILHRDQ